MAGNCRISIQFRQDLVRQLFTQLHTPLIKAEDVSDNTLYKDFVFVHRD